MITYNFAGQTVIVTGGTRGIGAAISRAFLFAGAKVVATYGGNGQKAEEFASSLEDASGLDLQCFDVGNYEEVEKFFKYIDEKYERVEVLVNNAGIRRDNIVGMMPKDDWQRVLDTNLTGAFNMSKFAIRKMMSARYGRIIGITSPSGRLGFVGQANYAATKAGLVAMTKSIAKEVAKRKITVNCVSPGFIDTDLIMDLPDEQKKGYKAIVPMKRFGTTTEVANTVLFLASEESAYITGATIEVCGGI